MDHMTIEHAASRKRSITSVVAWRIFPT